MKVTAPKLFFEMEGTSCVMVASAGSGLEEEEIELELGLSIGGGSYKKQTDHKKLAFVKNGIHLKNSDNAVDASFRAKSHQMCGTTPRSSDMSPSLFSMGGDTAELKEKMDPKRKREIHALRRQEAKKKREEKQQKKGFGKGKKGMVDGVHEGLRARDFQANEREFDRELEEREFKKSKTEDSGSESGNNHRLQTVSLNLSVQQHNANNHNMSTVLPMQYSHPQFSYGPPANDFVYPCGNVNGFMMPVWFGGRGAEKNVVQVEPVLSYSFGPVKAGSDPCHNLGNGYELEHGGITRYGMEKKAGSNASSICTSSEGSDHCNSSREGGVSFETRSLSIHSVAEQPQSNWSKADDVKGQAEHSTTSDLIESSVLNEETSHVGKMIPCIAHSSTNEPREKAKSRREAPFADNHFSTVENPASGPLKERNGDKGKAPKPRKDHDTPSLPYMPCVSTTGNGPNGKTINGFLYRYTQSEVGIICVCHGSSFSPAEFVQHAGGTDVSHPLRHITVIPSPIR